VGHSGRYFTCPLHLCSEGELQGMSGPTCAQASGCASTAAPSSAHPLTPLIALDMALRLVTTPRSLRRPTVIEHPQMGKNVTVGNNLLHPVTISPIGRRSGILRLSSLIATARRQSSIQMSVSPLTHLGASLMFCSAYDAINPPTLDTAARRLPCDRNP
jgi:hypothetical protein